MFKNLAVVSLAAIFIAAVLLGPLAVIWAFNTLFGTTIEYSFWTWLAVIILSAFISPNVKIAKKG